MHSGSIPPSTPSDAREIRLRNFMAGLTTSFVVVSLGAAFGVMSGRGAFAGMLSAALIGIVVSLLGGTRISVSGPTGPITAVTAATVAFAYDQAAVRFPDLHPEQFVSFVLIGASALLMLFAFLRLGRLIHLIPQLVISGFMNGIAVLIWMDVAKRMFGLGGKTALQGSPSANLALLLVTLLIAWKAGPLLRRLTGRYSAFFPATLVAIVIATSGAAVMQLSAERTALAGIKGVDDLVEMMSRFLPGSLPSWDVLSLAAPFAFSLAFLNYLDSLMTALVMDKLTNERSKLDRELFAQGVGIAVIVPFGGVPGAQATIRSVLLWKEGATLRWAGMLAGVIALAQVLVFQDAIAWIPQAVFMGILVKVGIDVFDWTPLRVYVAQWRSREHANKIGRGVRVSQWEFGIIAGTTAVTVLADLNLAVVVFTALFYGLRKGLGMTMLDLAPPPLVHPLVAPPRAEAPRTGGAGAPLCEVGASSDR